MQRSIPWIPFLFALVLPVSAWAAEDPKAVFDANCVKCHGADGKGDTVVGKAMKVVSLADPKWLAADLDLVKLAKENPKHAAFIKKLSDEQIQAAVVHVKELAGAK